MSKNKKENEKSVPTNKVAPMPMKVDPKSLYMPPKVIFEESIKTFLAVILFILFLILFGSVAWYFFTQLDTTLVSTSKTSIITSLLFL